MARKVVDHRQRPPVFPVEPQQADLRIDRTNLGDLFVGRKRVRVAHVRLLAVLESEPAVLHDAILMADARADIHRNHTLPRFFHCLDSPLIDIRAHDSMTMAGIDQDIRRLNVEFLFDLRTHFRKIVVADRSDLRDGDGVDGDDGRRRGVILQYKCLDIQAVIDQAGLHIGNVRSSDSRPELGRNGSVIWE